MSFNIDSLYSSNLRLNLTARVYSILIKILIKSLTSKAIDPPKKLRY